MPKHRQTCMSEMSTKRKYTENIPKHQHDSDKKGSPTFARFTVARLTVSWNTNDRITIARITFARITFSRIRFARITITRTTAIVIRAIVIRANVNNFLRRLALIEIYMIC
jgi:hypothetical protein